MTPTLLLLSSLAQAGDPCDAKALEKAVMEAPPSGMAEAYVALASCDAKRGKKAAASHMKRMVADNTAIPALVAAIKVGAAADVRAWIAEETPDSRSRLVNKLGGACATEPAVASFFVSSHADLGAQFWEERWYRGLDACRTPEIQQLLTTALTSDEIPKSGRQRTGFVAVLEVYARNLGAAAVPVIAGYLAEAADEEEQALLVGVFGDAARVGSMDGGMDAEAASAAAEALVAAAPGLSRRSLDRARGTLAALGAAEASESIAQHAWPDVRTADGYTYGVALTEAITCKNGKTRGVLHLGSLIHPGTAWPDTVAADAPAKVEAAWQPADAKGCKGTGEISVVTSDEPLSESEVAGWHATQRQGFDTRFEGAQKSWIVTHSALTW
ncbi:MAG: hypothetical protein H6732_17820 [Alphaproteobacteria bacterium]|nr:hypothetical protein [Alphaproteobacteria bacterium]